MLEIRLHNVVEYLHDRGWLDRQISARAEVLAWGISNSVLRVTPAIGEALVVKQSRAQLRTKDPWFSRLDRIYPELVHHFSQGDVPEKTPEQRDQALRDALAQLLAKYPPPKKG
jgi:hypothetical protein